VAARFSKPGQPYHGVAKVIAPRDSLDRVGGRRNGWTGDVRLVEEHLADPLRWTRPRRIFVNSMSDLFHERVPDEWIDRVFAVMALAPRHTFQVLTKRPERMRAYMGEGGRQSGRDRLSCVIREGDAIYSTLPKSRRPGGLYDWPLPNLCIGVSVEDQATADARIPLLLQTPAAVRFVSYEPALGPVDLTRAVRALPGSDNCANIPCLDQIIVGGESGPGARPFDVAWARSTIAQCRAAGVACFVKQLGARPMHYATSGVRNCDFGDREQLRLRDRKGGDMDEWSPDLRVREMPRTAGERP
jgi:protein gp37